MGAHHALRARAAYSTPARCLPGGQPLLPLELDMRCGIHEGDSSLVTGLDQRARARLRADKMSLAATVHKAPLRGERPITEFPRPSAT
jgi:hypothetical protein